MGNAMGDLTARRGMVQGMDEIPGGGGKIIRALVPLAEMFGYSTTLRSLTQGRATYTMEFKHYAAVPKHIRQRHQRADDLAAAARDLVHPLHHAAPRRQVAHHIAHEVFRRFRLDLHHRLQQHRCGLAHAVLEGDRAGHAEGVFVRIDVVI